MSAITEPNTYTSIDRSLGFEPLDYVAFALATLMTLAPLAAATLLAPI